MIHQVLFFRRTHKSQRVKSTVAAGGFSCDLLVAHIVVRSSAGSSANALFSLIAGVGAGAVAAGAINSR